MRLTPFLLVAVFAGACPGDHTTPCDPGENQCPIDAPIDASSCDTPGPNISDCPAETPVCSNDGVCAGCATNADCEGRGATPACFEPSGACVACDEDDHQSLTPGTADDHCPTTGMQVCDAASHTCRACRADSECTNGLCNELAGECANTVLHVDNDPANTPSDANDCLTTATPCLTVAGAMAKAVSGTRYIAVHASDVEYNSATGTISVGGAASVYLRGIPDPANPGYRATLKRSGNGPILTVDGSSAILTVDGITLSDANGSSNGDGVMCLNDAQLTVLDSILENNTHFGISSTACSLVIDRSFIRGNRKGGGHIGGSFSITNTFVFNNIGETFGGLQLDNLDTSDVFEHNTIYSNSATTTLSPGGVRCSGSGMGPHARHNIIYSNTSMTAESNIAGCSHAYSLIGTTVAPGTGNIAAATVDEIHFANIQTLPYDLHLTAGSVALDKGGPNGGGRTSFDVDGDPRPPMAADLGADEILP